MTQRPQNRAFALIKLIFVSGVGLRLHVFRHLPTVSPVNRDSVVNRRAYRLARHPCDAIGVYISAYFPRADRQVQPPDRRPDNLCTQMCPWCNALSYNVLGLVQLDCYPFPAGHYVEIRVGALAAETAQTIAAKRDMRLVLN